MWRPGGARWRGRLRSSGDSWWGWGWEDEALSDRECTDYGAMLPGLPDAPLPAPDVADLVLPPPRIAAPASLSTVMADDPAARASHAYGKAYRDVVRALHGRIDSAPDLVARPTTEAEVVDVLDWATRDDVAVVPYGGGSSVVGGVECSGEGHAGVVSLDLSAMDRVLDLDRASRAARIQAGAFGPVLEDQLRPSGYTLRHFPQSFEFSTLGGWLATRAGGHYATLHTHIDDFVESLRVVTPVGTSESWRLPGSGAGPSPDRLFLGSEGILGVITEAWMRIQERPEHRRSSSVTFTDETGAFAAVRAIAQAGLYPSNLRVLDPIITTAHITRNHGYMIYDVLIAVDENFEVHPQMTDFEVSDDGLTYTFYLRRDVLFHNDRRVTADDVHREVKARAARAGMSLSDYLLREVETLVKAPTVDDVLERVSSRKRPRLSETPAEAVRAERSAR